LEKRIEVRGKSLSFLFGQAGGEKLEHFFKDRSKNYWGRTGKGTELKTQGKKKNCPVVGCKRGGGGGREARSAVGHRGPGQMFSQKRSFCRPGSQKESTSPKSTKPRRCCRTKAKKKRKKGG